MILRQLQDSAQGQLRGQALQKQKERKRHCCRDHPPGISNPSSCLSASLLSPGRGGSEQPTGTDLGASVALGHGPALSSHLLVLRVLRGRLKSTLKPPLNWLFCSKSPLFCSGDGIFLDFLHFSADSFSVWYVDLCSPANPSSVPMAAFSALLPHSSLNPWPLWPSFLGLPAWPLPLSHLACLPHDTQIYIPRPFFRTPDSRFQMPLRCPS